jgi:thioredoxin:protein disulfide reductase
MPRCRSSAKPRLTRRVVRRLVVCNVWLKPLLHRSVRICLAATCFAIAITSSAVSSPLQSKVVTIKSAWLARSLTPGQSNLMSVETLIADGWHINSDHPSAAYLIPTHVSVSPLSGFQIGEILYPPAQNVALAFEPGQQLAVYTGRVKFGVPITPPINLDASAALNIQISYQACNDHECLRPASVSKSFPLALVGAESSRSSENFEKVTATGSRNLLTDIFRRRGYLAGFLIILVGGLALNLTPCVYPLIGVTIAYFGYEGGGPRKVVVLAVLYVLGIALTFSGLGVAAALSGGLFGSALQNPYVLATIAAILLLLAAASFGLLSLQPPAWMMRSAGSARPGYAGALAMGLGMGVVAAPCIGPIVLGLLIMVQQSASAILGFALFFTLALGLGLPYVALALAAGSIRRLPRSGEWLAWVEQLFGFVLVGLALYFIDPLIPGRLISRILPYYAAGVGIFLGFASSAGRNSQPFFIIRSAVGMTAIAGLAYLLITARSAPAGLIFRPFDPSLLRTAQADRRPVVLDFSADWCVPCREMERTTFADPAVLQEASNFVWLKANLTAANPHNAALMKQFEVAGVPTTVFIDAKGRVRASRPGYIGPREFLGYLTQVE